MTTHQIPKGVSAETLRAILAGWSEVGAENLEVVVEWLQDALVEGGA